MKNSRKHMYTMSEKREFLLKMVNEIDLVEEMVKNNSKKEHFIEVISNCMKLIYKKWKMYLMQEKFNLEWFDHYFSLLKDYLTGGFVSFDRQEQKNFSRVKQTMISELEMLLVHKFEIKPFDARL